MANNEAIELALADLNSQKHPNYKATAEKYSVNRTTLARWHKGLAVTRQQSASLHKKVLTDVQEQELLKYINKLSDRGLPPTPKIVENLVYEITKTPVGKNWVDHFCECYKNEIKSIYLRRIDQRQQIADNSRYFEHFYTQVGSILFTYFAIQLLILVDVLLVSPLHHQISHQASPYL